MTKVTFILLLAHVALSPAAWSLIQAQPAFAASGISVFESEGI